MRFISFDIEGKTRPGVLLDNQTVLDIRLAAELCETPVYRSILALIESGDAALESTAALLDNPPGEAVRVLADLQLLAPLPVPQQIRDFANYEKHCIAAMDASMRLRAAAEEDPDAAYERMKTDGRYTLPPVWYESPLYYKGIRFATSGHDGIVEWPHFAEYLDYELELACVTGRQGRDIPAANAQDYIFGYTIFNDFSARDIQARWEGQFRMGPAKGKDFDTGNAFGPWIVTRDEISDPYNLAMSVRVNGELRGSGNSGGAQHGFERCIEQVSMSETIFPGEIMGLGTIPGGCGFESLTRLAPGDVIELEIEGIGVLRNTVQSEKRRIE
jgi:2-keto-4-pentenoate hydratase/2-oxohepta-3-ene-1,7-dioic acid hydratase in catechol pathway